MKMLFAVVGTEKHKQKKSNFSGVASLTNFLFAICVGFSVEFPSDVKSLQIFCFHFFRFHSTLALTSNQYWLFFSAEWNMDFLQILWKNPSEECLHTMSCWITVSLLSTSQVEFSELTTEHANNSPSGIKKERKKNEFHGTMNCTNCNFSLFVLNSSRILYDYSRMEHWRTRNES